MALLVVGACALGLLTGLVRGGRPKNLASVRLRWWPLAVVGLAGQVTLAVSSPPYALPVALASLGLLLVVALRNLLLTGMSVVALGLGLILLPMALNAGMPVRGEALLVAGLAEPDELATLELEPPRHLETDDDRLAVLGDALPIAPLGVVVSFGALVLLAGLWSVTANLLLTRRPTARIRPLVPTSVTSTPLSVAEVNAAADRRLVPAPPPPSTSPPPTSHSFTLEPNGADLGSLRGPVLDLRGEEPVIDLVGVIEPAEFGGRVAAVLRHGG